MKKLLVVAGFLAAMIVGSVSAANAGVEVCYDINVNGNAQAGCETVELPAPPALP